MLDAQVTDCLQLFPCKDLSNGVVGGVENDHAGVVVDSGLQLVHVDGPVTSGSGLSGTLLRGMEGHVDNLTTRHLNVVDVLIEERLKDNDLVAGLDKAHEGREHALVCAGCDGDLFLRIQSTPKEGRVCVCQSLLQARSSLGGRVLVALDSVQSTLGGIDDELGRVVAEEALSVSAVS